MADLGDPLVVEIFHAFEVHDDAVEDQDGDYTRGLARLAAYTSTEWFVGWLETKFREAADWADNPACPDRATYLQVAGAHLGLIGDLDPDRAQRLARPKWAPASDEPEKRS